MDTYTVEKTRSGHLLLVEWPDVGSSISMAYRPD